MKKISAPNSYNLISLTKLDYFHHLNYRAFYSYNSGFVQTSMNDYFGEKSCE